MSTLAADSFNRADASLTDNVLWANSGAYSTASIVSNEVKKTSGGDLNCSRYIAVAPNDQYAEVLLGSGVSSTSDEGAGGACRIDTGGVESQYFTQTSANETKLYKVVSGSFAQLGSDGASGATGDLFRCLASGTSISALKNGTATVGPITDASLSSGAFGLWITATGNATINSWEGGDPANSANLSLPTLGPGTYQRPMGGLF